MAWNQVQAVNKTETTQATTLPITISTTTGNTLVVVLSARNTSGTLTGFTVSDSAGNTWVNTGGGPGIFNSGKIAAYCFWSRNATAVSSITITSSGSISATIAATAMEFSGLGPFPVLDTNAVSGYNNGATTGTSWTVGSFTLANPVELVIAYGASGQGTGTMGATLSGPSFGTGPTNNTTAISNVSGQGASVLSTWGISSSTTAPSDAVTSTVAGTEAGGIIAIIGTAQQSPIIPRTRSRLRRGVASLLTNITPPQPSVNTTHPVVKTPILRRRLSRLTQVQSPQYIPPPTTISVPIVATPKRQPRRHSEIVRVSPPIYTFVAPPVPPLIVTPRNQPRRRSEIHNNSNPPFFVITNAPLVVLPRNQPRRRGISKIVGLRLGLQRNAPPIVRTPILRRRTGIVVHITGPTFVSTYPPLVDIPKPPRRRGQIHLITGPTFVATSEPSVHTPKPAKRRGLIRLITGPTHVPTAPPVIPAHHQPRRRGFTGIFTGPIPYTKTREPLVTRYRAVLRRFRQQFVFFSLPNNPIPPATHACITIQERLYTTCILTDRPYTSCTLEERAYTLALLEDQPYATAELLERLYTTAWLTDDWC